MRSRADLHEYQRRAVQHILDHPACALWLDLGLGKTISTLTAIADLIDSCVVERVLVIAPLRVARTVWAQEMRAWAHTRHLRASLVLGSSEARSKALRAPADIYVINRENIPWLVERYGTRWPYDCVVIDEASSFKSSKALRWRALRKVRKYIDRIIQLTATPASNGLEDLWAQVYLLDGGERLGRTKTGYLQRWFDPDYWGKKYTPRPGADEAIRQQLTDIVLSMQASDYLNMPERVDVRIPVTLPPPAQAQYEELKRTLLLTLADDVVNAANAAVLGGKLMQLCNGAVYAESDTTILHDAKLDALADLREDSTEPMLVAYTYRHDLARLRERFPDAVAITDPGAIDRWNRGEIGMLLAHPASAGHGLNLQHGGSLLVWFGLTWSLELYQQFNGRLHRQGQTRPVRVVHLVADGCIDERVLDALSAKQDVQQSLVEGLKSIMGINLDAQRMAS
jgi:hypothetical protein